MGRMGPPAGRARRSEHIGRQWRPTYRWALSGAIAAVILALITATALWSAADTARNGVNDLSEPVVSLLWQARTGQPVTSGPTITSTGVFLGGADGTIRAFDPVDGDRIWTFPAATGHPVYVRASAGGVVYATTGDGVLVAVDADTGGKLWGRTTETTFNAPPAIGKDRVFAAGGDSFIYSNRTSGSSPRRVWTGGETLTAPAVVKAAAVVASTDENLYVLSSWYIRREPRIGRPAGGPVAAGNAACTPLTDGSVRCVRISDGDALPRVTLRGTMLSALASDGNLLFAAGANGAVGAWDPDTGAQRWLDASERPAAGAGHLVHHDGLVVVTYPDGRLTGLDARTGRLLWKVTLSDHFDMAPRVGDMATYVVGRTGTLYALQTPQAAASATPSPTPSSATSPAHVESRPHERPPSPTTSEPSVVVTSPSVDTESPTPTQQPTDVDRP
jgi:outer membrane protein assembly factor BamB